MPATSTDVKITVSTKTSKAATLFAFARPDGKVARVDGEIAHLDGLLDSALADGAATGKSGETARLVSDGRPVVLLGLGDSDKPVDAQAARSAGASAAKLCKKLGLKDVALLPPGDDAFAGDVVTGFLLAAFEYREYRGAASSKREAEAMGRVKLAILADKSQKSSIDRAIALADAQNYARTVASRPGNDINPPSLAQEAQQLADEHASLTCRVLDEKQLRKLGMGGILAVGQGSGTPPRLICLEYRPGGKSGRKGTKPSRMKDPLLIVGKAITFDTGGLSLKPPASMPSMIFDKCGGMAVLGAMHAVAATGLDRPVVGLLAAAENMPGPHAYRPGDILKMYNGVTVDVTNTDAEGRLVLADALSWGIETYKPAACVDLATLTGACVIALGNDRAGAFCNDDRLFESLRAAGDDAGEGLWRLPIGGEYRDALKAPSADIFNAPGRPGGASTAAEFLHHFIPGNLTGEQEVPWCHLDIAGPATAEKEMPLFTKGATGFGVRTLVEWVGRFGR
jgi:leucyl aminopeptidase